MREWRVLVVGGGTMGRGIAGLSALAGHATSVYEAEAVARKALRGTIEASWARAVARGKLSDEDAARARDRLRILDSPEDSADAELVVEAVPESLELKCALFAELDRFCAGASVLASNTSSLSIEKIAASTCRPDRVLGLHFFNPVATMPLVELVHGRKTSREAEAAALEFARSLKKQPIRVRDSPGFATSRLGVALGLEAMRMIEEGVASAEDIDRAMELGYGHRMGPLKTSDLVGLDVRLSIAEELASKLSDERFRPPEILRRLVAEGRTGKKSGRGFYRWESDEPVSESPDRERTP